MCHVMHYLREQTEHCRVLAISQESAEWAQVSLMLQREQTSHADRCLECTEVSEVAA
jgi:RNA polymerase subunit RPABC4/transcription elongation factor Spt4